MRVSPNFLLQEFIPPTIYNMYDVKEKCLWVLDIRIIKAAQLLRDLTGCNVIINNWHNGGEYTNRGYRLPSSKVGATYSQHKFGRAIDVNVEGMTVAGTIDCMLTNFDKFKAYGIRTIEHPAFTPSWVHMDCREPMDNYPENSYFYVKP